MANEIKVVLSKYEFFLAAQIGMTRSVQNIIAGRKDRYGAEVMDGWGISIEGTCGEAAVAKHLNIFYTGNLGDLKACDINNSEKNIEVRTAAKDYHSLILHPGDPDESLFILVTGKAPVFYIRGWIRGKEGKDRKFWKDPTGTRPAYFVPQSALECISTIPYCMGRLIE